MQYGGGVLLYGAMILQATQFTWAKMCNKGHVPDHEGEDDYPQFKSILYQSFSPRSLVQLTYNLNTLFNKSLNLD